LSTRWKYESPRLIDLIGNPATGARNTVCSSGGSDSCNSGSCDNSSTCLGGSYARVCNTNGSTACSLTKNAACCSGSGVTADTQYACSTTADCLDGYSYGIDGCACNNGEIACVACSWGYGTVNNQSGCYPGNGN
jgi:hypothetical protein